MAVSSCQAAEEKNMRRQTEERKIGKAALRKIGRENSIIKEETEMIREEKQRNGKEREPLVISLSQVNKE